MSHAIRVTHEELAEKIRLAKLPPVGEVWPHQIVKSISCAWCSAWPVYECVFEFLDGHRVTYFVPE